MGSTTDPEPQTELQRVLVSNYKEGMVRYLDHHPQDLKELVELAIEDLQPYSWRAAWLLAGYIQSGNVFVQNYLNTILTVLPSRAHNQQRDLLRLIDKLSLSEEQASRLYDLSVGLWEQVALAPAVRYNAFKQMVRIIKRYPELRHELELVLEPRYTHDLTKGVRHSVGKMVKDLGLRL